MQQISDRFDCWIKLNLVTSGRNGHDFAALIATVALRRRTQTGFLAGRRRGIAENVFNPGKLHAELPRASFESAGRVGEILHPQQNRSVHDIESCAVARPNSFENPPKGS